MDARVIFLAIALLPLIPLGFQLFGRWRYKVKEQEMLALPKEKIGKSFILYFLPAVIVAIPCQIAEIVFYANLGVLPNNLLIFSEFLVVVSFVLGAAVAIYYDVRLLRLYKAIGIPNPNQNASYCAAMVVVEFITLFLSLSTVISSIILFRNGIRLPS
ncbi:MAG: hypothetical protein WCR16_04445 [Bacilli bacterium]|jgi:hypothetical protein